MFLTFLYNVILLYLFVAHRVGKAGGGWEDEDESPEHEKISSVGFNQNNSLAGKGDQMSTILTSMYISTEVKPGKKEKGALEDEFMADFLNFVQQWPVLYSSFMEYSRRCSMLDKLLLLQSIKNVLVSNPPDHHIIALLTLIDTNVCDSIFTPVDVEKILLSELKRLAEDKDINEIVSTKAKRIQLVTEKLGAMCK